MFFKVLPSIVFLVVKRHVQAIYIYIYIFLMLKWFYYFFGHVQPTGSETAQPMNRSGTKVAQFLTWLTEHYWHDIV